MIVGMIAQTPFCFWLDLLACLLMSTSHGHRERERARCSVHSLFRSRTFGDKGFADALILALQTGD